MAGAQSASFYFTSDATLNSLAWAALLPGKLKSVLTQTYAAADGDTAIKVFMAAWAAAGGMVVVEAVYNNTPTAQWSIDEAGYPVLTCTIDESPCMTVRVAVSYSASE